MKTPNIEQYIVWNGNGSYTPTCDICGWQGKDRPVHAQARAAVVSHRRTKAHQMREETDPQ